MELQTSLINDAVWASKTNAKSLIEISSRVNVLEQYLETSLTQIEELGSHATVTITVDETLEDVTETLNWMESHVDKLETSIATLTMGRLPHQLFPPTHLRFVLNEVMDKLSPGWTFSTYRGRGDTLVNTYRDAEVTTGIVGMQLQAYIHIPTYELATQFQLYEIINLPEASKDGLHQAQFAGLPDFLAASSDGDRFLELSFLDVNDCLKSHAKVCKFRTPIAKSDTKTSCALALFKKDNKAQAKVCKTKLSEWEGSRVVYLDQRRWAMSDVKEQELMISCPRKAGQVKKNTSSISVRDTSGM